MEASLPSTSWRGKGSLSPVSHLLDWERGHFRGLAHRNSASVLVSTRSVQVWPSPAPPVSIRAGVSEREGSVTGASCIGGSSAGVSCGGVAVVPILGPLGPTTGPLACLYDSSRDSLGRIATREQALRACTCQSFIIVSPCKGALKASTYCFAPSSD